MGSSDAKRELARRELARRHLLDFTMRTFPGYEPGRVHRLLARMLEQVERFIQTGGKEGVGRLMVFMPPRHGKSELVSVRFPAWFLGRNPERRVILASATSGLALGFSRKVRDTIRGRQFQTVFGKQSLWREKVDIARDSSSAEAWNIEGHRGGMVAAGVGGSIIGRGADLLIIDDPFRDRRDAESRATREAVDSWYKSTAYTRLEPGGAVVLMHQRWHEDDLAGRLLRRMADGEGDRWTVVSMPALAEEWAEGVDSEEWLKALKAGWWKERDLLGRRPGEALWPERFPAEALEKRREVLGGYEFEALYQQRPRKLEGTLIKAYLIPVIEASDVPEDVRRVRYWDLAVSPKAGADFTAGGKVAMDREGRLYIEDVRVFKGMWPEVKGRLVDVMVSDGVGVVQGMELAGQQRALYDELRRDERVAHVALQGVNPREAGDKETRALVWASRIEDGLVFLVRGPWNDGFLAEAVAFPNGAHDDQVDAVSGAVQMLTAPVLSLGSNWRR